LLHRLSGQDDLVVGIPMALRAKAGSEPVVGNCVNFLPLRLRVDQRLTCSQFLRQVRSLFLKAWNHHEYSFGSLLQKLRLPRHSGRKPLVGAIFNVQRKEREPAFSGLQVEWAVNPAAYTHFDLTLDLLESDGELQVDCTYRRDLFEAGSVQGWLKDFQDLLARMAADPGATIPTQLSVAGNGQTKARSTQAPLQPGPAEPAGPAEISPIEEQLMAIWSEILGGKKLGIHDNFFDLGGHSVLVIQILSRVRRIFGVDLTLRAFFEGPTISEQAQNIEQKLIEEVSALSDEEAERLRAATLLIKDEGEHGQ
jgi:non-ribosomal peptide synthetase component F